MVDPVFDSVPTMAANPNVEQIATMAPDLVIMKGIVENETGKGRQRRDSLPVCQS